MKFGIKNMSKSIFKQFFSISLFILINLTALQSQLVNQNVNINFLGDKSGISINYERVVSLNKFVLLGAQLGVGVATEFVLSGSGRTYLTMPSQLSTMIGLKNVYLEVGAKGIPIFDKSNSEFHLTPFAGLRLQTIKKRSVISRFHFSASGLKTSDNLDVVMTRIGMSFGVIF